MKKKIKTIIIPEHILVSRLREWINECDADDLARITEEVFGGKCFQNSNDAEGEIYSFEPNENYYGAFDDLKKGKKR